MVISKNPQPNNEVFLRLLSSTLAALQSESKKRQKEYLGLIGNKLESVVADVMTSKAIGTPFENTIELISGQRFPDIIAKKYYGVEVKTTTQDHWTTTGNSVLEGTRVDGIERIYMFFGKMCSPVEFRCRPYEECLSEVVVTHSPRYLINMELASGETIFDKLSIPYDELRKYTNPIKPIIEYYRQFLNPGEQVWWMDQEEPKSTGLIIKLWNNLPVTTRREIMIKSMVFFPEIFSNRPDKFNKVAVWLVNALGVVCPNIRDVFTAGGQGIISWDEKRYSRVPKIIVKMADSLSEISMILSHTDKEVLRDYWDVKIKDRKSTWIELVHENSKQLRLQFDMREFLSEKM